MTKQEVTLKESISTMAQRWSVLTPLMLQMGIIEELLNRKLTLSEKDGLGFTVVITEEGMTVEDGKDPFAHAHLSTTREQWEKIFAGSKTYATIFRFELAPVRDVVYLNESPLIERFCTVLQALVLLG